jgi:hypothetical protein
MCRDWTPQVFVRDVQPPGDEACPGWGRRVPIRLLRVDHRVDLDASEAKKSCTASSQKLVPITRE